MKWLSILISATTALVSPTTGVALSEDRPSNDGNTTISQTVSDTNALTAVLEDWKNQTTFLEQQAAAHEQLVRNTERMTTALAALRKTVGHTWYAYSGDTPSGWDCSGLVVWTYEQLGITVEHRADLQAHAGKVVTDPKPGDIMVFSADGGKTFYHSAIYLGNGQLVQALRPGTVTRIDPVGSDLFAGNTIRFIRIVETDPANP